MRRWWGSVLWMGWLYGQVVIKGAYLHGSSLLPAAPVDILVQGDTIAAIGVGLSAPLGAEIIEARGLHAYPGLVALSTPVGLVEVEAVRATRDQAETGEFNPNALTYTAFNIDSRTLPTLLANGILYAESAPEGSLISGQSALFRLQGRTREEGVVLPQAALYIRPPSLRPYAGLPPERQKKAREEALKAWTTLYELLETAQQWCRGDSAESDLRYAAICPYFRGKQPVVIGADWAEDIEAALALSRRFDFRMAILGGVEALRLASALREAGVTVILQRTHALPPIEDSSWEIAYRLPKALRDSGLTVVLAHNSFWNQRNLAYQGGTAAAYGLSKEEALQLMTEAPATWLGLNRIGRLAVGYKASLILTEGDFLDPATSSVVRAWIEGRPVPLSDNPQEILYRRYR